MSSYCSKIYSGSKKVSLNMFWKYLPSSANIASDWLRAESSPVDEEEIKIKMDGGVARFFSCFGGNCFICWLVGGAALSLGPSWITLWGMIKVYWLDLTWLDFSLHFRSCCLLRVCRKFGPKLASHYKPVKNEVKFVELSEPCSAN